MLNEFIIRDALETAHCILEDVLTTYKRPYINDITICKAKSYWAAIKIGINKNEYNLKVSNVFNDINDLDEFNNKLISTMIHECIHTIPGCWNHQQKFKAIAALVNSKYPRYYVGRATSVASLVEKPHEFKYRVTCKCCGHNNYYMRKPQIYDYCKYIHTPFTCNICGKDSFEGVQLR